MDDLVRELTPAEAAARKTLDRWKATHEKQVRENRTLPVLKGSLTRVKRFYEENFQLTVQAIELIEDVEASDAARTVLEEWELEELEWQDERDYHIRQLENPTPMINAHLSADEKRSRYQTLHLKAQTHAEGLLSQLKLICDNLASTITSRALKVIKEQINATKAEVTDGLWEEYEKLIELSPDQRQNLSEEYAASKKNITDAAAMLLTAALSLLPASPVTSTPNNSLLGASESNSTQGSSINRQSFSYQKEKLPIFDGQLRSYPRWARQWKHAQQFYGEDQFFLMLDRSTPKWLDILSNSTIDEAWQQLDARFANTRVVAQAALADYSAFVPKSRSKNDRLIEVAEHVNRVYSDLCAVDKGGELDQTENLILKVLEWVDKDHRDDLVDLYRKDEQAPKERQVGVFQLTYKFLKDNRLNLMKYTALTEPPPSDDSRSFCRQCKKEHPLPHCKKGQADLRVHHQNRQDGDQGAPGGGGAQTSPHCKYCKKKAHTFTSKRNSKVYTSSRYYDCPEFMKLNDKQRADHLEGINGCSVCTSPDHDKNDCKSSWQKCGVPLGGDSKCQERHNRVLHNANTAFVVNNIELNNVHHSREVTDSPPPVLLFIQRLQLRGKYTTSILYDSGSNSSLITRSLAKLLNLPKRLVGCWITVATRDPEYVETYAYELNVPISSNGKEWTKKLVLYEVPGEITTAPQKIDVSAAYALFPNVPAGALERPSERVGILLGLDAADLMPVGGDAQSGSRQGNLLCLRTMLGGAGYVLGGSHPDIKTSDVDFTATVNGYKQAKVVEPVGHMNVNTVSLSCTPDRKLLIDNPVAMYFRQHYHADQDGAGLHALPRLSVQDVFRDPRGPEEGHVQAPQVHQAARLSRQHVVQEEEEATWQLPIPQPHRREDGPLRQQEGSRRWQVARQGHEEVHGRSQSCPPKAEGRRGQGRCDLCPDRQDQEVQDVVRRQQAIHEEGQSNFGARHILDSFRRGGVGVEAQAPSNGQVSDHCIRALVTGRGAGDVEGCHGEDVLDLKSRHVGPRHGLLRLNVHLVFRSSQRDVHTSKCSRSRPCDASPGSTGDPSGPGTRMISKGCDLAVYPLLWSSQAMAMESSRSERLALGIGELTLGSWSEDKPSFLLLGLHILGSGPPDTSANVARQPDYRPEEESSVWAQFSRSKDSKLRSLGDHDLG